MALSHPLPDDIVDLVARRFRALGEPVRIRLLERLREGEASVTELVAVSDTTPQNVSKHLGILLQNGIVARRKQGTSSYYRIADEVVFELCERVCGSIDRELASLGELISAARL